MAVTNFLWKKSNQYQIINYANEDRIHRAENSTLTEYRLVDTKDVLLAALRVGKVIQETGDGEPEMMAFFETHGLLGFFQDLAAEAKSMSLVNMMVPLRLNPYIAQESLPLREYLNNFFPDAMSEFLVNDQENLVLQQQRSVSSLMSFGEPLSWTKLFFQQLYKTFSDGLRGELIALYSSPAKLRYRLEEFGAEPHLVWEFPSLKSVLEYSLFEAFADKLNPYRECKRCGKVFYAQNRQSEFCSVSCRNVYNVYKNREKKRAQQN